MARYNPQDPRDYLEALDFINQSKEQGFEIELGKYRPKRSGKQNRYLHVALGYFAHCYGCTLTEAKEIYFKRYACPHIFRIDINDKEGNHSFYYRSTTDLTTVEMASAIKNFQSWASARGVEIPDPQDEFAIRYCERQIEKTAAYCT
jgi:hypothetical protein